MGFLSGFSKVGFVEKYGLFTCFQAFVKIVFFKGFHKGCAHGQLLSSSMGMGQSRAIAGQPYHSQCNVEVNYRLLSWINKIN